MAYFEYMGKQIYYQERGTGHPLLLLHGNTASSNMFYEIADQYAQSYKVILFDFLGHGQSDRLQELPTDLWFEEAQQVIAFLKSKDYQKVHLLGSSGGALVAINVALEAPELVSKVIADSFEGETTLKAFTENIVEEREASKQDEAARFFYSSMHGDDWEQIVDQDTAAIVRHDQTIGTFFHKPLSTLQASILLTGSKEDEFVCALDKNYFERVYHDMLQKIGHGAMYLFASGGHPALLSNPQQFFAVSERFFNGQEV